MHNKDITTLKPREGEADILMAEEQYSDGGQKMSRCIETSESEALQQRGRQLAKQLKQIEEVQLKLTEELIRRGDIASTKQEAAYKELRQAPGYLGDFHEEVGKLETPSRRWGKY